MMLQRHNKPAEFVPRAEQAEHLLCQVEPAASTPDK
jgi:hypothetical protein